MGPIPKIDFVILSRPKFKDYLKNGKTENLFVFPTYGRE